MKNWRLKLTAVVIPVVLIVFAANPLLGAETQADVSIQLEGSIEYYGKIDQTTLEKIESNELKDDYLKVESVYWFDSNGNVVKLSQANVNGHLYGYSDTAYFKLNTIVRITPLIKKASS